jgi:hypothetical protein
MSALDSMLRQVIDLRSASHGPGVRPQRTLMAVWSWIRQRGPAALGGQGADRRPLVLAQPRLLSCKGA